MNERENKPNFIDKDIVCLDCEREFVFTAGEQEFFWSKGLAEPKRCPSCRKFRRVTLPDKGVRYG